MLKMHNIQHIVHAKSATLWPVVISLQEKWPEKTNLCSIHEKEPEIIRFPVQTVDKPRQRSIF